MLGMGMSPGVSGSPADSDEQLLYRARVLRKQGCYAEALRLVEWAAGRPHLAGWAGSQRLLLSALMRGGHGARGGRRQRPMRVDEGAPRCDPPREQARAVVAQLVFPAEIRPFEERIAAGPLCFGADGIFDAEVLVRFDEIPAAVAWCAPGWMERGDIIFFYYTKRAGKLVEWLVRETLRSSPQVSEEVCIRAKRYAERFAGTLFGCAVLGDRDGAGDWERADGPEPMAFRPLRLVHLLAEPVPADQLRDLLPVPHAAAVAAELSGERCALLARRIAERNTQLGPLACMTATDPPACQ